MNIPSIVAELFNIKREKIRGSGFRPYKTYVALLTQESDQPPTTEVLENTLGFSVTWEYVGPGNYRTVQAFTANKTTVVIGGTTSYLYPAIFMNAGKIEIVIGGSSDNDLTDTTIEIRVYP